MKCTEVEKELCKKEICHQKEWDECDCNKFNCKGCHYCKGEKDEECNCKCNRND